MPSRSSVTSGRIRTALSATSTSNPPASALGMISEDGRRSVKGRTRCGTINPTNPIIPATATPLPTVSPTPAISHACRMPGRIPIDRAAASPRISASRSFRAIQKQAIPAVVSGAAR